MKFRAALLLMALVASVLAVQGLSMPAAAACDIVLPFSVTPELLTSPDFADESGALRSGYRDYWNTEDSPIVVGAYVVETVHTVEPEGTWTRGSVSTVVEYWGQTPEDLGPFLDPTVDLSVTPQDTCGEPSDGPALGNRDVLLLTDSADATWSLSYVDRDEEAATAALDAVFGDVVLVDRDEEAEQLMIARLGNARSGAGTGIAIAFGAILIVGGVLAYRYRKRKLLWQWDQIQAELAAAEQEKAQTRTTDSQ